MHMYPLQDYLTIVQSRIKMKYNLNHAATITEFRFFYSTIKF